jgi:GTP-binding protein
MGLGMGLGYRVANQPFDLTRQLGMRFVDEVEILCVSGRGGDGAMSFLREIHRPRGGPDGGDGGRGGDVVLVASARRTTLEHLRGQRSYRAKHGRNGRGHRMTGGSAQATEIEVPVGTMVIDLSTDDQIADLTYDGARALVCLGGHGGKGNVHFKSGANRTPRKFTPGGISQEKRLRLELKLLADVGLLGFPNAGKSTLISRISEARPKVADYPFTTLIPNLGVVSMGWEGSFVVADIPGLVPGASEGVGLGIRFLKHVERCRFLLHLVSMVDLDEALEGPFARYEALQHELQAFSSDLAERPQRVVLTKRDAVTPERVEELVAEFTKRTGEIPFVISSITGLGLKVLADACWLRLQDLREES